MSILLPLLIVMIHPVAPIEARSPGAIEVFHCPFDASWDKNFDHWPDEWRRREGPGFPRYVAVEIREEATPAGTHCLRIDLNGGAVAVWSPPIPIAPWYTYVLEGLLKADGLRHDRVSLSLILLDEDRHPLQTLYSDHVRDTHGWQRLRVGPIAPGSNGVRWAVVGLHLEPDSPPDLAGSVRLADVWLGRLPRISLSAGGPTHVFADSDQIAVTCDVSGLSEEAPRVVFRLEDAFGAIVAQEQQRLETRSASGRRPLSWESFPHQIPAPNTPSEQTPDLVGSAQWQLPDLGPGFYRVRATVHGRGNVVYQRELSLAVIRPDRTPRGSEFGWTLPQGDRPLGLAELSGLIGQAGIGWVKYPLWFAQQTHDEQLQAAARFAQDLASQGIELVGLLDDPPEALRSQFQRLSSPAEIFIADPELWYPSLESALARMGVQVRWWQLGGDQDTGFVGYPKLAEKIAQVKAQLDQLGVDAGVGFGWNWRSPLPLSDDGKPAWRFLALSADPPLADRELAAHLEATIHLPLRRWVVLEPLARDSHPLEARAADLVQQMTLAKVDGAEGIFIPDPFCTDRGLIDGDGSVGDLFLPWRTTALMLGGAEYLGTIQLPEGSRNHVFSRGADAVMLVRSDTPKQEVIYLGDEVRQVDLWGRTTTPHMREHRQVIEVGPLPSFVTGVDPKLVHWRQSFSWASDRLASVAGGANPNRFRLRNPFDGEVSGHLELVAPHSWKLHPRRTDFRLRRSESLEQAFQITLPYDATNGRHGIRIDFELDGQRRRRFSVYRHFHVGPSDVYIEVATRLNEQGELEVEQRFVNQSQGPVSFRCHLFAPNRRRQNTQIIGLAPGRQVSTYRLADGAQLVGKTLWLRAEQIDGPRVLNYRFTARGQNRSEG